MMHGLGMAGSGIGFLFFGLLSLALLGGGLYILLRKRRALPGSKRKNRIDGKEAGLPATRRPSATEIFRLAKRNAGALTVSDVVSELGADPKDAEELLDGLTDGRRVDMEVDSNGVVRYVFREFTK